MNEKRKPVIALSFQEYGKNGGPYVSHKRIMESSLKEKYEFIPFFLPRLRDVMNPVVFYKLVKELKNTKADLFQFTGLQLEGFFSMKLGNMAGVPTVCAIRGSTDEAVYVNRVLKWVTDRCEKKTLEKSSVCYAVSEYVSAWEKTKKYTTNFYGYIYNFFDFSSVQKSEENRRSMRDELNVGKDEVVVVSTGRIIIEKGYSTIKEIILSGEPWDNVVFVIVGEGNYRDEFEQEIKNRQLEKNVRFLGYRDDIDRILDGSDIYLSCTWHETFGNSIIEGSYHSLPVIASKVGGVPEIIENGVTGYLVDYQDVTQFKKKLKELIDNQELRKKMGKNGLDYIRKKFNPQIIEDKLDRLYQLALKGDK